MLHKKQFSIGLQIYLVAKLGKYNKDLTCLHFELKCCFLASFIDIYFYAGIFNEAQQKLLLILYDVNKIIPI
jgi:hypothetical protein